MSLNLVEYLASMKTHMDNDTIVFIYKNCKPVAINREWFEKTYHKDPYYITKQEPVPAVGNPGDPDYEPATTKPHDILVEEPDFWFNKILGNWDFKNLNNMESIYYKNNRGVWVDLYAIMGNYNRNYYQKATDEEAYWRINKTKIPQVDYTDKNGRLWHINEHDGTEYPFAHIIRTDIWDENVAEMDFIDVASLGEVQPPRQHRKDLRIKIKEEGAKMEDYLVWLNGTFLSYLPDNMDPQTGYIEKALSILPVVRKCQKADAPVVLKQDGTSTVIEDDSGNLAVTEVRYDVKPHLFRWEGITVERIISPTYVEPERFIFKVKSDGMKKGFDLPKKLCFDKPIDLKESVLLLNGVILNEDVYELDPDDHKKIILKGYYDYALQFFLEEKGDDSTNWFDRLRNIFLNNQFTLITFKAKEEGKKVVVCRDRNLLRNAPYYRNMLFKDFVFDDMVLVDGHYIPYEIVMHNTIQFPDRPNLYDNKEMDYLNYADIYRLRLYITDDVPSGPTP